MYLFFSPLLQVTDLLSLIINILVIIGRIVYLRTQLRCVEKKFKNIFKSFLKVGRHFLY